VDVRSTLTGPDSSRFFKIVPAHRSTMPQINMKPHPVTLKVKIIDTKQSNKRNNQNSKDKTITWN